jgi:hypothetical protein
VQHQILEQLVLEARELELLALDLHFLRPRVEHDRPADELGLRPAARAPQQRVDASEQLLDVERLHDVVVGAELQRFDLVLPAVASREHEDRIRLAVGAHLLDQLDAGNRRQAEVDDREIDRILLRVVEALAAVLGTVDGVTRLLELSRERLIQSLIVFDE